MSKTLNQLTAAASGKKTTSRLNSQKRNQEINEISKASTSNIQHQINFQTAGDGKKTVLRNSQLQSDENHSYLELRSNESGETKKPDDDGNLPPQDVQKQAGSSLGFQCPTAAGVHAVLAEAPQIVKN